MLVSNEIRNSRGERLDFTYHPGTRSDALVILGHGLTGNKDRPLLVAVAEGLARKGWPCLRLSYSGSGASEGEFTDATITKEVADLRAVVAAVPAHVQVAYAGHSMGSAVGVMTAADELRIRALVSLAGMARTADFVAREFGGLTPGVDCMWDETEHPLSAGFVADMQAIGSILPAAGRVSQPWLLVHGAADDLVPVEDGRDAYAAAACPKRWVEIPGAGHSFDEATYPLVIEAMDEWLGRFMR